jgi:hypothetical protein
VTDEADKEFYKKVSRRSSSSRNSSSPDALITIFPLGFSYIHDLPYPRSNPPSKNLPRTSTTLSVSSLPANHKISPTSVKPSTKTESDLYGRMSIGLKKEEEGGRLPSPGQVRWEPRGRRERYREVPRSRDRDTALVTMWNVKKLLEDGE